MVRRLIKPSTSHSFFLFGARGTGKSTYLKEEASLPADTHLIDLLHPETENHYLLHPSYLIEQFENMKKPPSLVVIDEVQKVPKLLDAVHYLIEKKKMCFALTGSSARKLKRGKANLLAGRAFVYHLFPLTQRELGSDFNLDETMNWGNLPKLLSLKENEKNEYLRAYVNTYLKEEILQEQLIRNTSAFRSFLEVAAQENGKLLNFTKIGRDIGSDSKTIQNFFSILEDTLVGFFLPAFHHSVRKAQKLQPKFYLFDLGVKKAMEGTLEGKLKSGTNAFGQAFEHFVICEVQRLNEYYRSDWRMSQLQVQNSGEVDLILSKGRKHLAIEIKSSDSIDEVEVRRFERLAGDIPNVSLYFISRHKHKRQVNGVTCLYWKDFFDGTFKKLL